MRGSGPDQVDAPSPPAGRDDGDLLPPPRSDRPLRALNNQARRPILVRAVADLEAMADGVDVVVTNLARVPAGNLPDEERRLRDNVLAAIDTLSGVVSSLREAVIALDESSGAS